MSDPDPMLAPLECISEENYVKQAKKEFTLCPNCKKDNALEADGAITIGEAEIEMIVRCAECRHQWVERYELVGYYGVVHMKGG